MLFNQYYLDCPSHASYLIGDESSGRAVVVDPSAMSVEYIVDAKAAGMTIELVIETHLHADFSGSPGTGRGHRAPRDRLLLGGCRSSTSWRSRTVTGIPG